MAQQIQIAGAGATAKIRSPVAHPGGPATRRPDAAQRLIGLLLYLVFSPAFYAYMQSGLNSVWKAQAVAA
jgi:hypothetical protein